MNPSTLLCRCLVATLALLLPVAAAAQQHRGQIRGAVVDPSLTAIVGVDVRAISEATGQVRSTTSDDSGRFAIPELPPGLYRVEAEKTGYSRFVARVTLAVNQDLWLDVSVGVGTVIQAIDVTAPYAPLDRSTPALKTFIDQRQLAGLPLDGRNFLELSLLAPGTSEAPQGSASSIRGDFAFSVNGAREDFNGFLLDGVYNIDPKLNTPAVRSPIDAVREFEVLTSSYDATFGRNAAGQVNVVTRSGSNRFAGSAYEFIRDRRFTARNHFAPADEPEPDYSRHQFGGSIGGPIARNRTFFFADYEHTRLREGLTRLTTVPTRAERNGDFSQSSGQRPINPLTGTRFPGDQIPSFFQSPIGRAIAALYPEPNRSSGSANYVSSPTARDDVNQADVRVDQAVGAGSRLMARYSIGDRDLFEPFTGTAAVTIPGFGNEVPRRSHNVAASFTHTPSSSLVNDVRFGFSRVSIGVFAENTAVSNTAVGLPAYGSNPRDAGLSTISVSGFSSLGHDYTTPQESSTNVFHLNDTATLARGAHLLKVGGEWVGTRQTAYRDVQSRGFLNFINQAYTGNALADLLLGLPVLTGGARLDNPQNLRTSAWSLFFQDDWLVAPSVSVSLGLRYEFASPPVDAYDAANVYDPNVAQLVRVGTQGVPRGGYDPDHNNLAPRIGFAWMPGKEQQTVIRGGYGIYYNQGSLATSEGLYFSPPYFNLGVYFPLPGLPLTLANPFPASFPVYVPPSATAYQSNLQAPMMEHWNVNVQRQIGRSRSLEIGYVGSRGSALTSARDLNQPPASPNPGNYRPNPMFSDITLIESRGSSRYNALQLKFQQRASAGLYALVSYTYGKSMDDASGFFTSAGDPNFPQNSLDPGAEWGRSAFDVRHRFSAGISYELPLGADRRWLADSGWVTALVSDWELQGVLTSQSGRPFTVALLPEIDNSNTGRSNLGFGYNDRPNVTGDPTLSDPTAARWFDTSAFSMPAFGTFGNVGRNTLEGPGYRNANVAFVRRARFAQTGELQFRIEAFNLLNRANLDLPDAFFGSPTFGQVLSARSPRRWQLGVKVTF